MDKDELVEDIYESKRAFVVENLETYINQLDELKIKSLKRWLDRDDYDEGYPTVEFFIATSYIFLLQLVTHT